MSQLQLRPDWANVWAEFRKLLRDVVDYVGVKQAAFDLDVSPSQLLNALDERDRHHVRAAWLPYLLTQAPDDRAVEFLASLRGLDVQPAKKRTPAEELAALKATLADVMPPEMRRVIYDKAARR